MIISKENFDGLSYKGTCQKCKQTALVVRLIKKEPIDARAFPEEPPRMPPIIEWCWPCVQEMEKQQ